MTTRAVIQPVVDKLRGQGLTRLQVADELRRLFKVNAMVAARLAHGWSQQQAAEAWNARWPEDENPKTSRNFAYWEAFPSSAGYPASLATLMQLAELYQVAVSDLVAGVGDFRHLDEQYPGRDAMEPAVHAQPDGVASGESAALASGP
ncbi:MAG TPA: hypothetical protein VFC00_27755 [Micromonosporaceae bacterium]|nr:hypothetical protein [Micromonosporaceae bacterium]